MTVMTIKDRIFLPQLSTSLIYGSSNRQNTFLDLFGNELRKFRGGHSFSERSNKKTHFKKQNHSNICAPRAQEEEVKTPNKNKNKIKTDPSKTKKQKKNKLTKKKKEKKKKKCV